jgi:Alpha-lytic protease prodomain/Trypsin
MSRIGRSRLVLAALAVALAALLAAPAAAAAPRSGAAAQASPDALAADAMARQLGVTRAEAAERLAAQAGQTAAADRLTRALGGRAAGAYIDQASGALVVNVLDRRAAAQVRAAGAAPRLVSRSLRRLEQVKAALDRAGGAPGLAWSVDLPSNVVVVSVPAGRRGAGAAAFLAKARSYGSSVRFERAGGPVRTQAFYGGQAIYRGGARCSAGFITQAASGNQYVLTAGHCTDLGGTWTTASQTIGPVAASNFPGDDFGAIRISNPAALDPRGGVLYYGSFRDITGASRVAVGSTVCKTGSTTGTTCGTVLGYNTTVRYAEGTVYGLTRTNVCTQAGDSGGPLFAGSQAQGITSGGTVVSCSSSTFRSYFQPADEALSRYGLTLR